MTTDLEDAPAPEAHEEGSFESMLDELRGEIPEISVADARRLLDEGEVDLLLDVREVVEWGERRIPGSVHVPLGLVEWRFNLSASSADPPLVTDADARIVVYCAAGLRSLFACEFLKGMGYGNVCSVAGGLKDWTALGLPIEDETSALSPGARASAL